MLQTHKLTREQVERIRADPRKQGLIANDYGVHCSTISKIKCGRIFNWDTLLGKGGRMICPGCGRTEYIMVDWKVVCLCGWEGNYSELMFAKKISERGLERNRRT